MSKDQRFQVVKEFFQSLNSDFESIDDVFTGEYENQRIVISSSKEIELLKFYFYHDVSDLSAFTNIEMHIGNFAS